MMMMIMQKYNHKSLNVSAQLHPSPLFLLLRVSSGPNSSLRTDPVKPAAAAPRISEEEDEEGEEKEDGRCPALTSCCCCCCRSVCCSTLRRSNREGGGRRLLHAGRKLPLPWQSVASRRRRESVAFSSQVARDDGDEVPALFIDIKAA